MTDLKRLQIEVDACAHLEAGVRGTGKPTDVYPDWVYEAREAIRRQNENPPPWLPDLLAALGWQGGTVHAALQAVRRLVADDKARHQRCPRCEGSRLYNGRECSICRGVGTMRAAVDNSRTLFDNGCKSTMFADGSSVVYHPNGVVQWYKSNGAAENVDCG